LFILVSLLTWCIDIINALAGSVRWVSDLFAWLIDTLLNLPSTLPSNVSLTDANSLSLPDLLDHLQSTNTVSLHLLLSSTSRGFLTAMCRRLVHLDYIARKAMHTSTTSSAPTPNPNNPNQSSTPQPPNSLSPALRAAYVQIATFTTETVLRFKTIEDLLLSLNARVKTAYAPVSNPNPGNNQSGRNIQEIRMLFGGPLPESFKSVIVELYRKEGLLEGVRNEIDPAKLYFANFELLEVDEDVACIRARKAKNQTMDCFRKTWLPNPKKVAGKSEDSGVGKTVTNGVKAAQGNMRQGVRWRRCTRCASVMEDALTQRQQWLVMQSRRCFCSGYWVTLDTGEMML
jgi:mediator of RNA polymerase II transcription subunit 16